MLKLLLRIGAHVARRLLRSRVHALGLPRPIAGVLAAAL
jgi:hypothetical protein